jgi:outer membrane protein
MKKFFQLSALIALFFLTANTTVEAQKFGYINSAAVLAELPEVQQMRSNLEGLQTQLQKKGQQMLADYQTKQTTAVEKQKNGTMSPVEEKQILEELQKKEQEIMKFEQEMQQKLGSKEQELLNPILAKVNDAIQAVAKENSFQFIFDTSSGVLLYADESQDITSMVKAKL